jgi:hypothetical protein
MIANMSADGKPGAVVGSLQRGKHFEEVVQATRLSWDSATRPFGT